VYGSPIGADGATGGKRIGSIRRWAEGYDLDPTPLSCSSHPRSTPRPRTWRLPVGPCVPGHPRQQRRPLLRISAHIEEPRGGAHFRPVGDIRRRPAGRAGGDAAAAGPVTVAFHRRLLLLFLLGGLLLAAATLGAAVDGVLALLDLNLRTAPAGIAVVVVVVVIDGAACRTLGCTTVRDAGCRVADVRGGGRGGDGQRGRVRGGGRGRGGRGGGGSGRGGSLRGGERRRGGSRCSGKLGFRRARWLRLLLRRRWRRWRPERSKLS
jgi:hypothetical protein